MKYHQKKLVSTRVLTKVVCNACGNQLGGSMPEDPVADAEYVSINVRWGYYSRKDLTEHRADICESCWDKITATFKIPVVSIDYLDLDYSVPDTGDKSRIKFSGEIDDETAVSFIARKEANKRK